MEFAEASNAVSTALAPKIGYDRAAQLAKQSLQTGCSVRSLAKEQQVLAPEEIDRLLDLLQMTKPGR
jgi:fumarate hydratase class II